MSDYKMANSRQPLAESDYYPGDLLANVLRLPDGMVEATRGTGTTGNGPG
ncbi:hypothetical protein ONA91_17160 [Micromonospora sp. DR5-3]|nr:MULTISPECIES: hypothetical protein [unclassified Micromonospora]MCW3816175.1 hypothetical protein [Micromonospora sp. DR5-3]